MVTGIGGDEVVHEDRYLRDLAARRQWLELFAESWRAAAYSHNSTAGLLRDALSPLLPRPVRSVLRRLAGRRKWRPPAWATPALVESFLACPEPPAPPRGGFPSQTQQAVLRYVNHPVLCWALEALETRAARLGLNVSHPFLDRQLVEQVLAIPLEARRPGGHWKYLLRESLAGELPAVVRERRRKTHFDSLDSYLMKRYGDGLRERLFSCDRWRAERLISRPVVEALLGRLGGDRPPAAAEARDLWRVACFELWLRGVEGYTDAVSTSAAGIPEAAACANVGNPAS